LIHKKFLELTFHDSYLPLWFQAIKGKSAVQSGIDTLPLVLALVFGSISAGVLTGRLGYYYPFLLGGATIMPIGAGLMQLLTVNTGEGKWIGFQIVAGFGIGIGMQQPSIAAQTVLDKKDVPTGVSLMFFTQMLAGAIFVSVGQNVFNSALVQNLQQAFPGLSPQTIVNTGATDLRDAVSPDMNSISFLNMY
jgi:MFS family permease